MNSASLLKRSRLRQTGGSRIGGPLPPDVCADALVTNARLRRPASQRDFISFPPEPSQHEPQLWPRCEGNREASDAR
jgi:hypothetical protein